MTTPPKTSYYFIMFNLKWICLLVFLFSTQSWGQSVVEQLKGPVETGNSTLFDEVVKKISKSKRVFVITNSGNEFTPGDFVTLIKDNQLIARALVARSKKALSGIKIIKIYSLKNWGRLRPGMRIQILRGDDSSFRASLNQQNNQTDLSINSEDDLFSEDLLDEDVDEKSKRKIKNDNLIGLFIGQVNDFSSSLGSGDGSADSPDYGSNAYYGVTWAYQIYDNFWIEGVFGLTRLRQYPSEDLDTDLTTAGARLKYIFKTPFYSFLMPYVGFQLTRANSPGAGDPQFVTGEAADAEVNAVEELEQNTVTFGATIVKRIVPGWFVSATLGSDVINLGFCIEF